MSLLKVYGTALVIVAALDALWLGWLARDFYVREFGPLMAPNVRLVPAALFYLLYPLGLVSLALYPPSAEFRVALGRSALVGLVAYGAYDLTNLATLRGWSLRLSLLDMAWGVFVSAVAGGAAWWLWQRGPEAAA